MTLLANKIGVGEVVITPQAKANVMDALDHNRLSRGKWTREFESRFAQIHRRRFAYFVNSGTDALRIGLAAMKEHYGWKDGDTVLVPALTFVASVNAIVQNGLRPYFVDVDRYYGMDPDQVGNIFGRQGAGELPMPVAMMPVHLFGQTVSPWVYLLAHVWGVRVIADSCETMFVAGCAQGDVSCFSTFACHVIQTGVGGLATTDDPHLAELILSYANHGRSGIYTGIDDALGRTETIDARFHFDRMGYSSRATEMEAAIGCAELDDWERNVARRREIAARLLASLDDMPLVLPQVRLGGESCWMMFPVLTMNRADRDSLVGHLEANGIETRFMVPLTSQPYFKRQFGDIERNYPMAHRVNETGLYVGSHPYMTDSDVDHMIQTFRSWRPS